MHKDKIDTKNPTHPRSKEEPSWKRTVRIDRYRKAKAKEKARAHRKRVKRQHRTGKAQ